MKTIKTLLFYLLASIAVPAFANKGSQMCPAEIAMDKGNPTVPAGWHVTRKELNPITGKFQTKMVFYIATYNLSTDVKDGKISCVLFGNERQNASLIELTNDQRGFPAPSTQGTLWNVQDNTGMCLDPNTDVTKPEMCPWG